MKFKAIIENLQVEAMEPYVSKRVLGKIKLTIVDFDNQDVLSIMKLFEKKLNKNEVIELDVKK